MRPSRSAVRILIATESRQAAELAEPALNKGVYTTRTAVTRADAATAITEWRPHMVVLHMDENGGHIMQQVAGCPERLPVIGLTNHADLKAKLAAFAVGVDDILTIPFDPEELLARSVALLRRSYSEPIPFSPTVKVGEVEIDLVNSTVWSGTSELHITGVELSLLYLLAANAGRVVTRAEILATLWGVNHVADSNIVERHIRNLRAQLLDDWRHPRFIATVPGRGYCFVLPVTETEQASGAP